MSEKRSSVCVVGAGLAGGIVASTLAARGHEVTLVELGEEPTPLLPEGESWEGTVVKSPFTRGSGIGGTSNFWHSGLTTLDKTDVEGILESPVGARLPVSYSELRRYYSLALDLLRGEARYSLDDIELPFEESIDGFGQLGGLFRLKALLYPDGDLGTRPHILRARTLHGLKVVTNTRIKRLVNSAPRRVAYAEGVEIPSGQPRQFRADTFVLCAGGLGSPKVLLESAEDCPPLTSLPVGRFIIDHPTGFVFKAKLRRRMDLKPLFGVTRRDAKVRYGFALDANHLVATEFRNHILYLRPALSMKDPGAYDYLKRKLVTSRWRSLGPLDMVYLLRHADLLYDAVNFRYGLSYSTRYVSGLVFAEQLPDEFARISRVESGKFRVRWRVSESDCRSMEKFLSLFFENFSEQFETFTVFGGMNKRLDTAGHHSGGCRMATNAVDGVVDADSRVFGLDNLFVADGSILGYAGHANTGLTIAALALKCCDSVAEA